MKKILLLAVALNVCALAVKPAQGQLPFGESSPDSMRTEFDSSWFGQNYDTVGQSFESEAKQNLSGGVQPAWIVRHNEQGHAQDRSTAMVRDRFGNIFLTGNSGTVKYNAAGIRKWVAKAKGSMTVLAIDGAGNVYVAGHRWNVTSRDYVTTKYNSAGIKKWEATYNGPSNFADFAKAIALDAAGNVYVAGLNEGGATEIYMTVKYNAAGIQQWAVKGPGTSIAVDGASNLYVLGTRWTKNTDNDYVLVKYNSTGKQEWEANYNGPTNGADFARSIVLNDSGAIYVTGQSWSGKFYDYVAIKYNSTGERQWVATYNGPQYHYYEAQNPIVDDAGNVYVTGRGNDGNYFTIKYDPAGAQKWVQSIAIAGGASYPVDVALAVDGAGSIYLAGSTWKVKTSYDYLLVKYDSTGKQIWSQSYNGPGNGDDRPVGLAVDETGNIYVGGSSYGAGTSSDYTLSKYDALGVRRWSVRHDEPTPGAYDVARGMCIDGAGNIYVTGYNDYGSVTIKYDAAGAPKWVARAPYKEQFYNILTPKVIVVDSAGNVYITGFCGTIKYNSAGTQQWVANTLGKTIAVDGAGNVYVAPVVPVAAYGHKNDYVIVKHNSAGQEQWSARYNGPGNREDNVSALAVDDASNVYVTGASGNATNLDYATIKYNSIGEEQWVARFDSPKSIGDKPTAIAVDNESNIYVTGVGGWGSDTNFFTVKYNSSGIQQWMAKGTGDFLGLDDKGNVYVTGRKQNGTNSNYVTAKYNAAGVQEWMATFDGLGSGYDDPTALALDGAGNVYVTGKSWNGASVDYATVKYNPAGKEEWVAAYNISKYFNSLPVALSVDATGSVYVAGSIENAGTGYDFVTIKYKQSATKKPAVSEQSPVMNYELAQNYPNPFSPLAGETFGKAGTMINFSLPETGSVMVNIYSETGQLVRTLVDHELAAGRHQLSWNGRNQFGNAVAAGVYFCRMTVTRENGAVVFMKTNRMAVVK